MGGESGGRMNICICMAESICHSTETIRPLLVNRVYPNKKKKKVKRELFKIERTCIFAQRDET